jgi:hypothetical protein
MIAQQRSDVSRGARRNEIAAGQAEVARNHQPTHAALPQGSPAGCPSAMSVVSVDID